MPETETVVPQDNTKVDEPVKTDKEVIAEEEAAQANEVRSLNIFCVRATEPYVPENIFTTLPFHLWCSKSCFVYFQFSRAIINHRKTLFVPIN